MKQATSDLRLAQILSWIVGGILVVLPLHAFLTTWLSNNVGHQDLVKTWKELVLILVLPFVLLLVLRSERLKQQLKDSWIFRLFLVYAGLHAVLGIWALLTARVNQEALAYAYIINLRFLGFFFICLVAAAYSDFLIKNWRRLLLIPAMAVILFGLMQKFILPADFLTHFGYGPGSLPAYQTVDSQFDLRRIQSFLRGANPLGAYLILIVAALYFSLRKNRKLQILSMALTGIVLFFSYSRSAWLGLVIAFGFLAGFRLASQRGSRYAIAAVAALVVLISVGIYSFRNNSNLQDTVFHDSGQSSAPLNSNEVRALALRQGVEDVFSEPLGRGPGTAGPASFRNEAVPRISENYFLQIGQEVGIVGMLVFIAINVLVALQLWARRGQTLPKILLVSLIGITIANLLLHAWTDDTLAYLWWGLAGVALATPALASRR